MGSQVIGVLFNRDNHYILITMKKKYKMEQIGVIHVDNVYVFVVAV